MAGNFGDAISQAGTNIGDAASNAYTSAGEGLKSLGTKATNAFNTAVDPSTYTSALDSAGTNLSQTGAGIKNLITGADGVSKAASTLSGVNPVTMGGMALYGTTSLSALDAQRDFLNQQKAAGNIAQAEYDAAVAEIDRSVAVARESIKKNPFKLESTSDVSPGYTLYGRSDADKNLYGRSTNNLYAKGGEVEHFFGGGILKSAIKAIEAAAPNVAQGYNLGPTLYEKTPMEPREIPRVTGGGGLLGRIGMAVQSPQSGLLTLYEKLNEKDKAYNLLPRSGFAMGGSIDDEYGMDEARGMMQGNLQKGLFGQGYAAGGTPRFLSGGGDGMSDDIPATINGNQPARLADGEFVIPADVVSHIGNGSSKAGAKQLYSMMDKVRKARTGNSKQGKQINPRKYLPA
jgi:hypothetical protein